MIRVGKIVASHGLGGDLIITHLAGRKSWLKPGDALFVALSKGSFIPHFVSRIKSFDDAEVILHFDDTDSVEAAKMLIGKEIFVQEDVLEKTALDSPLLWIGFVVIDEAAGVLGAIEDIYKSAQQWLAAVRINDKEVLLPLIEQTIKKVDINKRELHLVLPDGLLDIYA